MRSWSFLPESATAQPVLWWRRTASYARGAVTVNHLCCECLIRLRALAPRTSHRRYQKDHTAAQQAWYRPVAALPYSIPVFSYSWLNCHRDPSYFQPDFLCSPRFEKDYDQKNPLGFEPLSGEAPASQPRAEPPAAPVPMSQPGSQKSWVTVSHANRSRSRSGDMREMTS